MRRMFMSGPPPALMAEYYQKSSQMRWNGLAWCLHTPYHQAHPLRPVPREGWPLTMAINTSRLIRHNPRLRIKLLTRVVDKYNSPKRAELTRLLYAKEVLVVSEPCLIPVSPRSRV